MFLCLRTEFVQGNGRNKPEVAVNVFQFFLFNGVNAARLVASSVQVVQILYEATFCKGYGEGIHGMMAVVIAFGPVLYLTDNTPVLVLYGICHTQGIILFPVEFLHHINQLPVLAQAVGHTAGGGDNLSYYLFKNLASLFGNILGVTQISFNEARGNIRLAHKQFVPFAFTDYLALEKVFHLFRVFVQSLLPVF